MNLYCEVHWADWVNSTISKDWCEEAQQGVHPVSPRSPQGHASGDQPRLGTPLSEDRQCPVSFLGLPTAVLTHTGARSMGWVPGPLSLQVLRPLPTCRRCTCSPPRVGVPSQAHSPLGHLRWAPSDWCNVGSSPKNMPSVALAEGGCSPSQCLPSPACCHAHQMPQPGPCPPSAFWESSNLCHSPADVYSLEPQVYPCLAPMQAPRSAFPETPVAGWLLRPRAPSPASLSCHQVV